MDRLKKEPATTTGIEYSKNLFLCTNTTHNTSSTTMAVARARMMAMADDDMGPPDSPRDDSASLLRIADVRLDKSVMNLIDAENDAEGKNYECLNLLRSVPCAHYARLAGPLPAALQLQLSREQAKQRLLAQPHNSAHH